VRHLRIFNDARKCIFDLSNVTHTQILTTGSLIVDLDPYWADADEEVSRLVLAHRQWAYIQEIADVPPDDGPFTKLASAPIVPGKGDFALIPPGFLAGVMTEVRTTGGETRPDSDAELVHKAMQIHCRCASLRCPVDLNESTVAEKRRARWRMFRPGTDHPPFTGEPRQQCSLPISHDPVAEPHRWKHGEWLYGPAMHHPDCPRHPDRYNRGEGQPSPAGLTPDDQIAVLADQILKDDAMVTEIFGRHSVPDMPGVPDRELVRGYITAALPVLAGNSGPGMPLPQRINEAARGTWKACGVYSDDNKHWCAQPAGHDGNYPNSMPTAHETTTPGGDRLRW